MIARANKKRALIVDDDKDIVEAISAAIANDLPEYEIDAVYDGNTAVKKWEERRHSLIILDLMLPGRSGYLVIEKIFAHFWRNPDSKDSGRRPFKERPVIIMITGNPGARHESYGRSLGAADYLHKPFTMEVLIKTIKDKIQQC